MGLAVGLLQVHPRGVGEQQPLLTPAAAQLQLHPPGRSRRCPGPQAQCLKPLLEVALRQLLEGLAHGLLHQHRPGGLAEPVGREHPCQGMQQQPRHTKSFGQAAAKLPPRPAVANQHGLANVVAVLDGDAAHCLGHPLHGNRQSTCSQRFHRGGSSQGFPQGLTQGGHGLAGRKPISPLTAISAKHGRQGAGRQAPQHQLGIGDRGRPATAIAGGPRLGASRLGSHTEALAIAVEDRAPTGGHGVDWQAWGQQGDAGNLGLGAALDHRCSGIGIKDIGGGPTHVEAEHRAAQPTGRSEGSHHASGRPREDRVFGMEAIGALQGSAGAHHGQARARPQGLGHLLQVGLQHRSHSGLHHRRLGAGQQARPGAELVRLHHRIKAKGLQPRGQLLFMAAPAVAVQQGHGAALVPIGHGLANRAGQLGIKLQRFELLAIGRQAAGHLEHPQRQGEGSLDLKRKQIRAVLVTNDEQISEPPVDQQQHGAALPLQQRIGGHRGAQPHLIHKAAGQGLTRGALQNPGDGLNSRISRQPWLLRENLARHQGTAGGAAHHVGEGAAPINPKRPGQAQR